ncbi:probable tubulin polyglutamylase TTLL9 isoform X3 [Numida meleagris]|uniref:probable tubulin polyglutamylase TTLL9 isoform X3 n=1 Tax=Numida meleagris TaxID=8996 RepID=UPI000B3E1753|nr:probable tubulin polyglutamylase TTLL9 isoform X3 [Numida meleagris]
MGVQGGTEPVRRGSGKGGSWGAGHRGSRGGTGLSSGVRRCARRWCSADPRGAHGDPTQAKNGLGLFSSDRMRSDGLTLHQGRVRSGDVQDPGMQLLCQRGKCSAVSSPAVLLPAWGSCANRICQNKYFAVLRTWTWRCCCSARGLGTGLLHRPGNPRCKCSVFGYLTDCRSRAAAFHINAVWRGQRDLQKTTAIWNTLRASLCNCMHGDQAAAPRVPQRCQRTKQRTAERGGAGPCCAAGAVRGGAAPLPLPPPPGRPRVRFKCGLSGPLLDVLRRRPGWQQARNEEEWDFLWCDVSWLRDNFDHVYLEEHVRVCHFRNHYELSRKNYLVKNLKRFRKQLEREAGKLEAARCDFFPKTFELPSEYHLFVEEFRKKPGTTWIMKPVGRSQGKGIFLFRKLKDIFDWKADGGRTNEQKDETQIETYVAQRYIENPYLIGGRKFDLRVYILVTSFIPLNAWLYRDGFARFSSMRFTLNSIDDHYVHLTNVAVQKTAPDYDPEKGCKWMIQQLRQYLTAKHGTGSVEVLFADMDNIFIKSLQSVQKVIISDKHCFELYGYDILIDQDLKPWLLEVNASPSLVASSQEDYELKCHLLEDTLHIVDMEGRLTGKEQRVGGFDLMWNDGPVSRGGDLGASVNGNFMANTHLGCFNDRKKQLKELFGNLPAQQTVFFRRGSSNARSAGNPGGYVGYSANTVRDSPATPCSARGRSDGTAASAFQDAIDEFHFFRGHGVQVKSLQLRFTCEKVQDIGIPL